MKITFLTNSDRWTYPQVGCYAVKGNYLLYNLFLNPYPPLDVCLEVE